MAAKRWLRCAFMCAALGAVMNALAQETPQSVTPQAPQLKSSEHLNTDPVLQAQNMLADGRYAQAFAVLAPLEPQQAGEPWFDFVYGMAAQGVGENSRAIMALERAVEGDPKAPFHLRARAELAKLYFRLGENASAVQAFEQLQPLTDGSLQRPIAQYLRKLDERAKTPKDGVSGSLGLAWGRDSNINSAMSGTSIGIPVFGGLVFTLNPQAVRRSDGYFSTTVSAKYRQTFSTQCYGVAQTGVAQKHHATQAAFDQTQVDGTANLSCQVAPAHQAVLGVLAQDYRFNQQLARRAQGLVSQWVWQTKDRGQWLQSLQTTRFQYPSVPERNAHRVGLGSQWSQTFGAAQEHQLSFGAAWASERTDDPAQNTVGYGSKTLRAQWGMAWDRITTLQGLWVMDRRQHALEDAVFLATRRDIDHTLGFGVELQPYKHHVWQLQFTRQRNVSNIELYSYQRNLMFLSWRLDLQP